MRGFAIALLAGLLAATAPSAQALCAVDDQGGCSRLRHMLVLDVQDVCPDAASLCVAAQNESLDGAPNESDWAFRIHNGGSSAITVELHAIGFYDPETGEPRLDRTASQKLAAVEVPAGQDFETDFATYVPGNVSHVRIQVLSSAGGEAEMDAELSNVRIMMMQPGEGPVDDGAGEPAGNLDDHAPDADADNAAVDSGSKDSPGLPLALLIAGCLAAVLLARRLK
ncbi:MAG TPA: hypothetical protein VM327_03715 [Candidatus Thermoplasmatota archaeon]|nr:hypothetical protein [Candidatus Thermoplasmatota archaeon]